jgi:hypothetical protein
MEDLDEICEQYQPIPLIRLDSANGLHAEIDPDHDWKYHLADHPFLFAHFPVVAIYLLREVLPDVSV